MAINRFKATPHTNYINYLIDQTTQLLDRMASGETPAPSKLSVERLPIRAIVVRMDVSREFLEYAEEPREVLTGIAEKKALELAESEGLRFLSNAPTSIQINDPDSDGICLVEVVWHAA